MSALAAAKTPNPTSKSLTQAEADLRTEAVAIEKLRKQIQEAGSNAPKQMVADFAKRQKAYLDQKIVLEKQKRVIVDGPSAPVTKPAETPKPTKPAEVAKPAETPKPAEPTKPAEAPKAADVAKPAEAPKVAAPEKKPTESSATTKEAAPATSPVKKGSAVSTIVWLLLVASVAVAVWHFVGK